MQSTERKILLEEFKKVLNSSYLEPPSSSFQKFKNNLREWLILKLTTLMQRLGYNKRKISNLKKGEVILNIGCWETNNERYVNADLITLDSWLDIKEIYQFIFGNSTKHELLININYYDSNLLEYANGIVISHVLEHIYPQLVITALKNCFAYLKPGGCIRISVPYLEAYSLPKLPECQGVRNSMLAKNRLIYGWGHKFMYDPELLTTLMEEVGFTEVKEVSFKEGVLGETDNPKHQSESIYLTGIKA